MRSVVNRIAISLLLAISSASASGANDTIYFYEKKEITETPRTPTPVPQETALLKALRTQAAVLRPVNYAPRAWRKKLAAEFIRSRLKERLIEFLESKEWLALRETSPQSWRPLSQIPLHDLIQDIRESPYRISRSCRDHTGAHRDATAEIGVHSGTICFDPQRMTEKYEEESWNEFIAQASWLALALHEHLHHFGFWDKDHSVFDRFRYRVHQWLSQDLPAPRSLEVSPRFLELREAFRDGGAIPTPEGGARLRCSPPEIRAGGLNAVGIRHLSDFTGWLERGVTMKTSVMGDVISLDRPASPAPFVVFPDQIHVMQINDFGVWMMKPWAVVDPQGKDYFDPDRPLQRFTQHDSQFQVFPLLRQTPSGIVAEYLVRTEQNPGPYLPSVLIYPGEQNVLGYALCAISAD